MENFDQIERYILQRMTADEKAAFEARLENEPDLRNEKDTMADLILGVESLGLKRKLQGRKIGESKGGKVVEMKSRPIFTIRKLAVAASITAIFFCGWWFLQPKVNEEAQLFSEAFFPDPGLPTRMSETQNYNFYDAMVDYKMEKYEVALQKWENVKEGIGADTLQFYQGMALLNLGKNEEAKSKLSEVPQSSDFKNLADWYLVSLYIKSGKFSEAKALMGKIPSNINSNYKAIQSFLETK